MKLRTDFRSPAKYVGFWFLGFLTGLAVLESSLGRILFLFALWAMVPIIVAFGAGAIVGRTRLQPAPGGEEE